MVSFSPTQTERAGFVHSTVDAESLIEFLEEASPRLGADVSHAVVAAAAVALSEVPSMNQFVTGGRLYARNGTSVSITMRREPGGPLATVKEHISDTTAFRDLCEQLNHDLDQVALAEEPRRSWYIRALARLPGPAAPVVAVLAQLLAHFNLLPGRFIEDDPMHCSLFVVDLGRLGVEPGFRHLYRWGTCPVSLTVGRVAEYPVRQDQDLQFRKQVHLRYTFDRSIDDGRSALQGIAVIKRVLENPHAELGCRFADRSDPRPLGRAGERTSGRAP